MDVVYRLSCVDIGDSDPFVERSCGPNCWKHRSPRRASRSSLRLQPGYDHSYHFISKFMPDHVAWHAERLRRG